jgi:hypothetical protein
MHIRKLLLAATAVTILAVASFSGGLMGQSNAIDGVKVTLPHPVQIGDRVLDPGEYEIRRASNVTDQIVKIFNNDKMVHETNVLTIPNEAKDTPEESKVILHHIGDKYYFDKIWIHGKDTAWEFPLPERVRAEQRELALTIPARYEATSTESSQVAQFEPARSATPNGLAAELDSLAAQQDREQQAALAESERANRAEQDRQAELERQAALDRDRVAALQPEPAPALPTERSEAEESIAPAPETRSESPEQLPETATNWLGFVIGGILLLTASFFLRPAMSQE